MWTGRFRYVPASPVPAGVSGSNAGYQQTLLDCHRPSMATATSCLPIPRNMAGVMNYLAHIYLARQSDDAMVGALLGDFTKANAVDAYAPDIAREIRIHRKVDSFTDSHPIVSDARKLFQKGTRRFAGISLDVFYDHVLAKSWGSYAEIPLELFTGQFYQALLARRNLLPDRLAQVAARMAEHDWLASYREFDNVRIAVTRMSGRLSRNGELLRATLVDLEAHYNALSEGFHVFFPELIAFVEAERSKSA